MPFYTLKCIILPRQAGDKHPTLKSHFKKEEVCVFLTADAGWAPGVDYTSSSLQALVDAQNIAFADRNKYMGDSDFIDLPVPAPFFKPATSRKWGNQSRFGSESED